MEKLVREIKESLGLLVCMYTLKALKEPFKVMTIYVGFIRAWLMCGGKRPS
jgi:hypothetical protein